MGISNRSIRVETTVEVSMEDVLSHVGVHDVIGHLGTPDVLAAIGPDDMLEHLRGKVSFEAVMGAFAPTAEDVLEYVKSDLSFEDVMGFFEPSTDDMLNNLDEGEVMEWCVAQGAFAITVRENLPDLFADDAEMRAEAREVLAKHNAEDGIEVTAAPEVTFTQDDVSGDMTMHVNGVRHGSAMRLVSGALLVDYRGGLVRVETSAMVQATKVLRALALADAA